MKLHKSLRSRIPLFATIITIFLAIAVVSISEPADKTKKGRTKPATKGFAMTDFEKPSDEELRESLTPLQYAVTQKDGTEPPYQNDYWDNKKEGIYVDIVSGEPLFSSIDKYKSGTGWPSFTRPLEPDNIAKKTDFKMILPRTEVRSKHAGSHLGHVFKDGPAPTGLRYCLNSASMRFVPLEKLEEEGYGQYVPLFEKEKADE